MTLYIPPAGSATGALDSVRLSDDAFLEMVSKTTFEYFRYEVDDESGLIRDRSTPTSPCSIAATGFGLSSYCVAVSHGWMLEYEAYIRILRALRTFDEIQRRTPENHGFFYHFIDAHTGERCWNSEVSSVDTAILVAGMLHAAECFPRTELMYLAQTINERIDWRWMMNGHATLSHGYTPEEGFLPYHWEGYSEAILMYILALGSPTHPIPVESWKAVTAGYQIGNYDKYSFCCCPTGSLFTYQYPHVWVDFHSRHDGKLDYWENSRQAVYANYQYCCDNAHDIFGLTACDGPDGYRNYGSQPGANIYDGTIAPTAAGAAVPFAPEISIPALRTMYERYHAQIWGKYGFRDAFNLGRNWWATDYIGIDQGAMLLMIENYRNGGVWSKSMNSSTIQRGLDRAGFVDYSGD